MTDRRIDTRPRQQNSRRGAIARAIPPFEKWIRGRRCFILGRGHHVCWGKVRACHVDCAGGKGMGLKVHSQHLLPMCDGAHDEQHNIGWLSFQGLYRFNAVERAAEYFRAWLNTEMGRVWTRRQAEDA